MTAKKLKLVPALARLYTKPRKPTKQQWVRQQRQLEAWQRQDRKGEPKSER